MLSRCRLMARGWVCAILLSIACGCATSGSLDDTRLKAPERVVSETFPYAYEDVYTAARRSCLDLDFTIVREDPALGRIYAKTSPNMAKVVIYKTGFGEHVGIYFDRLADHETRISIVTQKSNRLEIGYKDYRNILVKLVHARLEGKGGQGPS